MIKIKAEDIRKEFPNKSGDTRVEALGGVNLDIKEGEFFAITDPSGCGKSTFVEIVAGLIKPTSGSIYIDGKPVNGPDHNRSIVFQGYALFPWRTVIGNVGYGLEEKGYHKSAKDLPGKKIAVHTLGGHAEYVTREYLARNNILKDDVQLIVMSHHEEVLRQGQVDVVAPVGAQIDQMEANGGVRVLFTDYDIIGNQTHCGLFMSEKFIRENPEVVKKFVEAN